MIYYYRELAVGAAKRCHHFSRHNVITRTFGIEFSRVAGNSIEQRRYIFSRPKDKNRLFEHPNCLSLRYRSIYSENSTDGIQWNPCAIGAGILVGYFFYNYLYRKYKFEGAKNYDDTERSIGKHPNGVSAEVNNGPFVLSTHHKTTRSDLPTFKMEDVSKHNSLYDNIFDFIAKDENKIWVTYGIGVYDITEFIPKHPGSDKILMGAGSAIDPFWHIFQQHNTPEILKLLETFRIGNLCAEDDVGTKDLYDPWSNEPKRSPVLKPASLKPFNAEPPSMLLAETYYTPTDFFYVRNHLPVPDVDENVYELEICVDERKAPLVLTLDQIKALPKYNVTAAIMCGGNRRSEMSEIKPVKGLSWGPAAVGNAIWSGPKLCDVLKKMNIDSDDTRHVHFEGLDTDPTSTSYAASIPLSKAMDPRGDVILAYEMNGQPLTRDHGFPVRVIVPGVVGARNVKWLGRIAISSEESDSHWQQNDYKGFSPSTDWDTVDFSKSPAIQNMPVTSAICSPQAGETVKVDENGFVVVKGYAWSGGGNQIVRVDISTNKGKTWSVAELETCDQDAILHPTGRNWGWTLWSIKLPVGDERELEIWAKAVDSNYNCQPETFENTWNLRGVLSNAYHRIRVKLQCENIGQLK